MRYLPDIFLYGNEKEITKITNLRGDLLSAIFFLKEILYFMIMLQLQEQNKLKKRNI